MRLLIATPLYPPDPGGPATYAHLLYTQFPHQVDVVKFSDVRRFPKLARHAAYLWKVCKAAKHADIVLALDPVSVGLPALWAAKLRKKTFVVKIVGDYAWEQGVQRFGISDTLDAFVARAHVPAAVSLLRAVQTHVAKGAQEIIVPSEYLKKIVMQWGIQEERIKVIYNAVELEEAGIVPSAAAAMPRPRVLSVGRLVPWKNMRGVIDAVSRMGAAVSLTIIGDGPLRADLEEYARARLGARALCTGVLTHADTLAVMKEADVFVLNSSYEGLSHVLIEALMLGKPVIATDVGGNGELISHTQNGMLVPSGDTEALTHACEELLAHPDKAQALGQAALTSAQRFLPAHMLEQTAALLQSHARA